jgi:hypothetical protein
MFNRCGHPRVVRVGLKILYRNPRRPGEAGIKLVPDQSQKAAPLPRNQNSSRVAA